MPWLPRAHLLRLLAVQDLRRSDCRARGGVLAMLALIVVSHELPADMVRSDLPLGQAPVIHGQSGKDSGDRAPPPQLRRLSRDAFDDADSVRAGATDSVCLGGLRLANLSPLRRRRPAQLVNVEGKVQPLRNKGCRLSRGQRPL